MQLIPKLLLSFSKLGFRSNQQLFQENINYILQVRPVF
ncbi:hypothetical protein PMIT1313_00463 [Prochlorococcus marinus str. MIT 1313]|nr:hypothetical protein PMIT1313_00463 [Prochlorococcus marinus str. MIT 1313]KZR73020.1 hypothetical protein PMIT1318_00607 [Prochlorococcus marinus str. MIT 1318]